MSTQRSPLWRPAFAVAWRHLYKWVSLPSNFLPTFIFPMVFFTAFSGGLSAVDNVPGFDYPAGYTSFIFVFSLLQTCMFGGLATGFTMAADFETGFSQRMFLCTQRRSSIIIGYSMSTFMRALLMCVVITLAAIPIGLEMPGSPPEIMAMYALALGMSFVGTLWATGMMYRGRSSQIAPAMQIPMFIAIFLAPVYVPMELLDGWLKTVASFNPISYIMEACRALLAGIDGPVLLAALSIVTMIALLAVWARTGVRSAERAG